MDTYDIEHIRKATFREARRGYDRREVEQFLTGLAEWLESGAADEARSYAVQRKLERAGETTARILATAEQEAEQLRQEAETEKHDTIEKARRQARETTEAAQAKARRTIDEGDQRREAIETVIKDLIARRDHVISEIERLQRELGSAVTDHKPKGPDPFAKPAVLDPAERDTAKQEAPKQRPARRDQVQA